MVIPPERPSRFLDGLLVVILIVAIAGHAVRAWDLPRIDRGDHAGAGAADSNASLDPRSLTIAYARVGTPSLWSVEQTEQVMLRLAQRWSEATQRRSRLQVLEETELRDVLVIFSDRPVNILNLRNTAAARYTRFAGGRIRIIEMYVVGPFDADEHAGTLLHELGHVLGCCYGPGTIGGHCIASTTSPRACGRSSDKSKEVKKGHRGEQVPNETKTAFVIWLATPADEKSPKTQRCVRLMCARGRW